MADLEARADQSPHDTVKETASTTIRAGEVLLASDGRGGYYPGAIDVDSGQDHVLQVDNVVAIVDKDANAISAGEDVYWDASASQAVAPDNAGSPGLDASADFYLGVSTDDAVAGDDTVKVALDRPSRYERLRPLPIEFDAEDGEDEAGGVKNEHQLIPAHQNPHGLLILGIYGIVTEQFAGASEDQGVVTVRDESDNTLATLTASDAGADAVGDVIVGTNLVLGGATGDAVKTVAAGEFVDAQVTQETSGSGKAGKMRVYILAVPLR